MKTVVAVGKIGPVINSRGVPPVRVMEIQTHEDTGVRVELVDIPQKGISNAN